MVQLFFQIPKPLKKKQRNQNNKLNLNHYLFLLILTKFQYIIGCSSTNLECVKEMSPSATRIDSSSLRKTRGFKYGTVIVSALNPSFVISIEINYVENIFILLSMFEFTNNF